MRATRSRRTTSADVKRIASMPRTPVEQAHRLLEARPLARRQVDLARIARDHHLGAFADAGQEHLHLHAGRVLRLVEDDEGVRQRAPAHEGERRDLDHAGVEVALHLGLRQHVVERVVERAQVGIDLLAHVARQEAQPLARLHGRARQHDAVDQPALEALRGVGDGEIGLAGARGPDAEHQIDALQGLDVGALHRRARGDDAAARADLGEPVDGRGVVAGVAQQAVDVAGSDVLALADARVELFQHVARGLAGRGRPGQRHDVAVGLRLDAEPLLQQRQMSVVFAEQPVQVPVVLEGHDHARLRSSELLAQACRRWPSNASQVAGLLENPSIRRICSSHPSTNGSLPASGRRSTRPARARRRDYWVRAPAIATSTMRPSREESAVA